MLSKLKPGLGSVWMLNSGHNVRTSVNLGQGRFEHDIAPRRMVLRTHRKGAHVIERWDFEEQSDIARLGETKCTEKPGGKAGEAHSCNKSSV